ncbi:MAG: glycoside hydrolase family 78 protein [Planctomycetaceae bacterium]|nr:glycoside hydrolase family 78 protein [Planctomycetaceae bacterium]
MRKPTVLLLAALVTVTGMQSVYGKERLEAVDLRCQYESDALGVDAANPVLSWRLESGKRSVRQSAYQILTASTEQLLEHDRGDLWDTRKVKSAQQNQIVYGGKPLASNREYFWKIRVWDQSGKRSAWSQTARWSTAILKPQEWKANWIGAEWTPGAPLPLFRKSFEISKPIRRAVVHVCGLGQYDLFCDGPKVGDHFLDPAWSAWENAAYYNTFELTEQLSTPGRHALAVMLGKGFYNTKGDRRVHGVKSERPLKLLLQAHLFYADGTEETIVTDDSWRTAPGPVTHSAVVGGEDFDARCEPAGWTGADFDDSKWIAAVVTSGPGGRLTAAVSPPLRKFDIFKPVQVEEPQAGIYVYDFGQNASAIPHLRVRGSAGQTIRLTPAEQRRGMSERRNDGKGLVNQAGVGRPNYFSYTCRGDGAETWTPQFSYTGYQYLQLEGGVPAGSVNPNALPVVEELTSVHVRADLPAAGDFECSNILFNRIDQLISWAVKSNLSHVYTDCPHREKLGWLEVPYLMGPATAARYDVSRYYSKIAYDCMQAQQADGKVPTTAPHYPWFGGGAFDYTPEWGTAAVVVPWQLYQWYGDTTVLQKCYPTMKGFVDYMHKTSTELVPIAGLGDWYDYGHGKPNGAAQFTDPALTAMATFYRCAQVVSQAAKVLGNAQERQTYELLAGQIKEAFNRKWFNGTDAYQHNGSPQASGSMALVLGLAPDENRSAILNNIVADIRQRGNQQTAGDICFWYLLQALTEAGRCDVIYDMTNRTDLGSYGYIVQNGWTSMPEAWDANTGASMNHCMLGHIQQWFMGTVAGIRIDLASTGFERIVIAPEPVGDLTWARGRYDSIRGTISASWKKSEGRFELEVSIPPNMTAEVRLPAAKLQDVFESGKEVKRVKDVKYMGKHNADLVLEIGSGKYDFVVEESGRLF